ncbi:MULTISPECIES: hypothetical protein [unclassified Microcystis]|uniref:hypothetical protein n=1 Tax=unclassified Microcystis TaxID=2643300 RepID=UPI0025810A45|nr:MULTISPECIES: hypothetical protein [unclassified Microcystis]MCA2853201.1 hypothetical protein [Microcystis sp. M076S1]MCA2914018.1 hypothetical protein [Microcystis sp. M022S1]MCA2924941.1 hypothetical protein [Microcystis sp. M020S1]MCA2936995.1 hypothetical protein [Microcystis sp. M015S1]MCA2619847.1 hypothetical protein [Microcystis sp. M099S2]
MGDGEVGKWGSGEAVSSPYHPKTLSPYLLLPHLNWQFKYLTAYNCIKMCNNSLANS